MSLVINVTYDSANEPLPTGFTDAVNYVVNLFEGLFTNSATINVDVRYLSLRGNVLGQSTWNRGPYDYSDVTGALNAGAQTATQQAAFATLPASLPPFVSMLLTTAEAKALGLFTGDSSAIDGSITINSNFSFSYAANQTPPWDEYYFVGIFEHELTEVMGRNSYLPREDGLIDLFRYEPPGALQTGSGIPAYFSVDGGNTNLDNFNSGGGDLGDWASTGQNDAFNAFSSPGVVNPLSTADETVMSILGWNLAPTVAVSIDNTDVNVAANTGNVTFTFSVAPADFTLANVTAVGGTLSNFAGSGTNYTATFTGDAGTDISTGSVNVDNNWHDGNGNTGVGGDTIAFTVDTVTPTVTVSIDNTDINLVTDTGTVTFTFSEAPTAFNLADTTATGGTLSNLSGSGLSYAATFTGAVDTFTNTASVSVTAGSWQEDNGDVGTGGSTSDFLVDTVPPAKIVLFDGTLGTGGSGLWVTDGTAGGTYELTGISGANSNGLLAVDNGSGPDFTVFDNEVLFAGVDASGVWGLWETDGTSQGTKEIAVSGAYPGSEVGPSPGIYPSDMTVLNGKVIFDGLDSNGEFNPWVTDGTAQGTHEITGVSGADPFGLNPSDFTIFNGKVLFAGGDLTNVSYDLWVTDGTAQGTYELGGLDNSGIGGAGPGGLDPSNMVVFNNELLFNGESSIGGPFAVSALWVTDGTAEGTHEITGISGASSDGLNPRELTVLGDEVLFEGTNASGTSGLWITDGTAQGTHEITGISGADPNGIISALTQNPDFTVFNNEVLFQGVDSSGLVGLWVTDGTAQGTHEIGGINGTASMDGLTPPGLVPQYMTVSNGEVLFEGVDANNKFGLWGTDGTSQGTHEIFSGDFTHGIDPAYLATTPFDAGGSNPPCLRRGTLILTDRGEVPVEKLSIGDRVITMAGAARPIKWIGRRSYSGRFVMGRKDILPICIKADALDEHVPGRDLWISPHHAMYLEGVLIEAKDLVNGVSIVQAEHVEYVEYFHIEFETHDVIVAEGALSESFVDDDSRGLFHNAHEYRALYSDAPHGPRSYFAPRVDSGYEVEAARQRIDVRAGLDRRAAKGPPALRGCVDAVGPHHIVGWAQNPDYPDAPVCLDLYVNGEIAGQTLANRYRDDLRRVGIGDGRHAFEFIVSPCTNCLARDAVEVRRSIDGALLEIAPPPRVAVQIDHCAAAPSPVVSRLKAAEKRARV
jgi:ELWxxDGT repeat protein